MINRPAQPNPTVAIVPATSLCTRISGAEALAARLDLPIVSQHAAGKAPDAEYLLVYTDNLLLLQPNPAVIREKMNPVCVDLSPESSISKRLRSVTLKDPLCRAVGIKPNIRPDIIDATAGFGIDGLSLAAMGCRVTMIERSPIMHALLEDGLQQAVTRYHKIAAISQNITLLHGNAIDFFQKQECTADSILIDPMFPEVKKGPLNKLTMRILRDIVGNDDDGGELVCSALPQARKRVAVKRPKGAEPLYTGKAPDFQTPMKSGRFDIYLTYHL